MKSSIRIATRRSPLALWQAQFVQKQLQAHYPDLRVDLLEIRTQGDAILHRPLAAIGGKGLFVKELEWALLKNDADIAVHSMKDVPAVFAEGLTLAAITARENPTDALVLAANQPEHATLERLPAGARIGTSSLRRRSQLLALRPDFQVLDCRGNVGTRLHKLDQGQYDALILASAGLLRLGLAARINCALTLAQSLPACGQGAIGIQARTEDTQTAALLAPLEDNRTRLEILAERALNKTLNGGCQAPIAGHAQLTATQLTAVQPSEVRQSQDTLSQDTRSQNTQSQEAVLELRALVASIDGCTRLQHRQAVAIVCPWHSTQAKNQAEALGTAVAEYLLHQGAAALLAQAAP